MENNFPAPEQVESTEETEKFKKWEESLRNKTIDELEAQADYVEGRLGSEHAALTNEINRRKTEEEAGKTNTQKEFERMDKVEEREREEHERKERDR